LQHYLIFNIRCKIIENELYDRNYILIYCYLQSGWQDKKNNIYWH